MVPKPASHLLRAGIHASFALTAGLRRATRVIAGRARAGSSPDVVAAASSTVHYGREAGVRGSAADMG